ERLAAGKSVDEKERPKAQPGVLPVVRNELADEFVVLPTPSGPSLVPWVSGSPLDLANDQTWQGGFVSKDELPKAPSQLPHEFGNGPSRKELLAAVLRGLWRSGVFKSIPGQLAAPSVAAPPVLWSSQQSNAPTSGASVGPAMAHGAPNPGESKPDL